MYREAQYQREDVDRVRGVEGPRLKGQNTVCHLYGTRALVAEDEEDEESNIECGRGRWSEWLRTVMSFLFI